MANYTEYSRPPESPGPQRIDRLDLSCEWRVGRELIRLGFSGLALCRLPRGRGTPVVLFPGWLASDYSMEPMRLLLKFLGYDAHHWGLGRNLGDPERDTLRMLEPISKFQRELGQPVALVGWSLGGVIAREIARELSSQVSMVITYGTPVIGGPAYTAGASSWGEAECARITRVMEQRNRDCPLRVPLAVIFTRHDRIVSWPSCLDHHSPRARHFEVKSSHLSMGMDPDVWQIVARQLAVHARP